MTAATIGLVIDLGTSRGQDALSTAIKHFPNKDFQAGIKPAVEYKFKFLIAAGRLDLVNDGIFMVLTQDKARAISGLKAANRRLAVLRAKSTRWMFVGDAEFRNAMLVALPGNKEQT